MAESDVVHDGQDLWLWDSTGAKVTHTILPTGNPNGPEGSTDHVNTPEPIKTPDQMAKDLLDNINPSTVVSVTTPAYVAGRPVYELVLQPRAAESTVDHVGISIDSTTGLPLRVRVFAKGHSKAAVELGFTSVSFNRPAASTFKFTPPPDSKVTTRDLTADGNRAGSDQAKAARNQPDRNQPDRNQPDQSNPPSDQAVTVGQDWSTVEIFSNVDLPRGSYEILRSATVVSGAFGRGRLVQSTLVNAVVLDDGRIAVGAVTPPALEAAVASAH
jgi:outer membrane lipoprotein-sorting protein